MHILVVDDKEKNVADGKAQLESHNHTVITAESYTSAIELITNQQRFDAVLTDLYMPLEDGDAGKVAATINKDIADENSISFTEGWRNLPMGTAVFDAALRKNVPYIGMISTRDGGHNIPSVFLNLLQPRIDDIFETQDQPYLIGDSLCFRTNSNDFHGYSPEQDASSIIPFQKASEMKKKAGWTNERWRQLNQAWTNAWRDDALADKKKKELEEYEAKNPLNGFKRSKNWAGLLQYMIDNDPRLKSQITYDIEDELLP